MNKIAAQIRVACWCGVMLLVGITSSGCQNYHQDTARTPGEFTDDVYVQAAVKTALVRDADVNGLDIHVDVSKGVVTVYGPVQSTAVREQVKRLATSVRGVKQYQDRLTLVSE